MSPIHFFIRSLVQKYLEFCQTLPYYGSAFFHGQIETPAKSLTSLMINHDTEVLLAINPSGFYVIDPDNVVSKRLTYSKSQVTLTGLQLFTKPIEAEDISNTQAR